MHPAILIFKEPFFLVGNKKHVNSKIHKKFDDVKRKKKEQMVCKIT